MQRTWDAMLAAPLTLDDIVIGEIAWCATRSVVSCAVIFVVAALLSAVQWGLHSGNAAGIYHRVLFWLNGVGGDHNR